MYTVLAMLFRGIYEVDFLFGNFVFDKSVDTREISTYGKLTCEKLVNKLVLSLMSCCVCVCVWFSFFV